MLDNRAWWQSSMKVALASTIAQAFRVPPAGRRGVRRKPLILCYHRVVGDFADACRREMPSMLISAEMFERHLEWFGQFFRFVSLDEISEQARSGVPFDEPVVAVTFDDGYQDVYEHAFPLLKARGIPAAVFIVTDLVGTTAWQTHDLLYYLLDKAFEHWASPQDELSGMLSRLDVPSGRTVARLRARDAFGTVATLLPALSRCEVARVMADLERQVGAPEFEAPELLTWETVREMRQGGITVGSHTQTHASLPTESLSTVRDELTGSKRVLEEHLGEPVRHFAYPGGQFTPDVVEQVMRAGYAAAYTACPHGDPRQPMLTMERLLLSEGSSVDAAGRFSPSVLGCQAYDLWPPAWRCERVH